MVMMLFADLNEEDFASKMIDDGLPPPEMPPFDGVVQLAARHNDPIGNVKAADLLDGRRHALLCVRKVNVSREASEFDLEAELIVEIFDETVEEMHWFLIGGIDQW